jgi:phosphohistidine swiveling domain-containing protein
VSTPTTSPQGVSSVNTQTSTQTQTARQEPATSASSSGQRAEAKTETKSDQQKMKDSATAKAKEEMKKAGAATTMEAQVATQGAVVGLMSFVPGFASYTSATIIDYNQIKMQRQYEKDTVDNRRVLRMLNGASDRLHSEMVDSQYNLGN